MSESTLKARVRADLTEAMRSGDKIRLAALRMLATSITNREKELRRELDDDDVREVASKEVKRRTEAIEAFEAGGREDLVERERAEREVLRAFAPEPLDEAAVDALVEEAIASTGATSMREMGKVMGVVMGRAKGRVDGSAVQARVRERLEG